MGNQERRDYSLKDISGVTGVTLPTLRVLARQGRLRGCYRIGGQWRMNRKAFDALRRGEAASEKGKV